MLVLEGRGLCCRRGNRAVFAGVDFLVKGGECVVVRGGNGTGKTSLLRGIVGFGNLCGGRVVLRDESAQECESGRWDTGLCMHYVGHRNGVGRRCSARGDLSFWRDFLGGDGECVERALEIFGLVSVADIPAGYLSSGQRKRVALSRLLLVERPVWILDEPMQGLDQWGCEMLEKVTGEHLSRGGLVMIAMHGEWRVPCAGTVCLGEMSGQWDGEGERFGRIGK